jgi:alpha-mannosidase
MSTCHEFFEHCERTKNKLMTWEGELYLELHNGTYTTMSEHKEYNRSMEIKLRDLEIFSILSGIGPDKDELKEMWYTFLID